MQLVAKRPRDIACVAASLWQNLLALAAITLQSRQCVSMSPREPIFDSKGFHTESTPLP